MRRTDQNAYNTSHATTTTMKTDTNLRNKKKRKKNEEQKTKENLDPKYQFSFRFLKHVIYFP